MRKLIPFLMVLLVVPAGLLAAVDERELFSEAETRYGNGNFVTALESYDRFVHTFPLSPRMPDVQMRRAVCLYMLERYQDSLDQLKLVESRYRSTAYYDLIPYWRGLAQYRLGHYEEAAESLAAYLRIAPPGDTAAQARRTEALAEVSLKRYDRAVETMESVEENHPSEDDRVLYGFVLLKAERYEELLDYLRRDDGPLSEKSRQRLALYEAEALYHTGRSEEAEERYRQLLGSSPDTAATAYRRLYAIAQGRGDTSLMERIVDEAEKHLDQPDLLMRFWILTGYAHFKKGEYESASYFLRKAWNSGDPSEVPELVPVYLSKIAMARSDAGEARRVLDTYLSLHPGSRGMVVFQLGELELKENNLAEALRRYRLFIEGNPGHPMARRALYRVAFIHYSLGALDQALQVCREADALQGDDETTADILHLQSRVELKMGRPEDGLATMNRLLSLRDTPALRLERIKLLYQTGRYGAVIDETSMLPGGGEGSGEPSAATEVQLVYLRGLSLLAVKRYRDAAASLQSLTPEAAARAGVPEIHPSALYYAAWARYRLRDFRGARSLARDFLAQYSDHDLAGDALYLEAWCSYSLGEYESAYGSFIRLAEGGSPRADKALFLAAKSRQNMNQPEEAILLFARLYRDNPRSSYADDALFEQASLARAQGRLLEAASMYATLHGTYPASELAGEALYLRGETLFTAGRYGEADGAFALYRRELPGGPLVDASLYWGGMSSMRKGDDAGALRQWDRLIDEYSESSFRPDAIAGAAEIHARRGEYEEARTRYGILLREYPDYAQGIGATLRLEELRYLGFGMEEREAELTAVISSTGGVESPEGRRAMLDLARLSLFDLEGKQERAFQLLSRLVNSPATGDDAATRQEAGILLGEYYFRAGEIERAGREFFNASLLDPTNRDLTAYTLYRAAQMMKLSGKEREMRDLLERLVGNFPDSKWSNNGRALLEESRE